jgi:hypothetical protein
MARIDLRNCTILLRDGLAGTAASAKKTNEKQTITVTDATSGTFTVTYATKETGVLPWNLTPAQLQSALEGLTSIGENNVSVTGTAGVSYVVEFIGTLGETSLALMTIDDTLVTGGAGVEVTIAETVDGGTGSAPAQTNTSLSIGTVALNSIDPDLVPVGARFTIAGEAVATTKHVVTARTPASTSPTTSITFTPALGAPATSYSTGAVLTFEANEVEITIGDGDLKYTEADQFKYDLDRGELDTVRRGDDQPMEVTTNFTFDQVKSGTGEAITPIEALKGTGAASEWVTSSSDLCEPYAVDVVVNDVRPCGSAASSTYTFPDFRSEKRDYDIKNATIAVSGKCNALEPIIVRGA